ncbi:MAG TPA: glycosyltransferase family 2 protein, partial [Thermoanaerobaculia bacterium]
VVDCLAMLKAAVPPLPVRVIDDGSTDETARLVAAVAAETPAGAVTLLSAGPLPDGWRGKVHAMAVGWPGIETPWVALTDADTRHHPQLVARCLAAAESSGFAAVSIAGGQAASGLGENLLVPPVFALLDALLGDWQAAADGSGPAVANGQMILLRRSAWDEAGGFATVRGETLDDVAIVKRLRAAGFRTAFFRAPDLLTIRMYRGFREAANGWRRNLGGLFGTTPGLVAVTLATLLLPVAAFAAALFRRDWVGAMLLWSAGSTASMLLRTSGGSPPAYGLLYPLDALVVAWVLACGVRDRRRGRLASWKGRRIRV